MMLIKELNKLQIDYISPQRLKNHLIHKTHQKELCANFCIFNPDSFNLQNNISTAATFYFGGDLNLQTWSKRASRLCAHW